MVRVLEKVGKYWFKLCINSDIFYLLFVASMPINVLRNFTGKGQGWGEEEALCMFVLELKAYFLVEETYFVDYFWPIL